MWAMRHRVSLTGAVVAVLGLGACTDASYRRDAAAPQSTDAGSPAVSEVQGDAGLDARTADADATALTSADAGEPVTSPDSSTVSDAEAPGGDAAALTNAPAWAAPLLGQFTFDRARQAVTRTLNQCQAVGTSTFAGGLTTDSGALYPRKYRQTQFHVRQSDSSRIVRGAIDAIGRHHDANYATAHDLQQLSCGSAPCAKSTVHQCEASLNSVRVSPLGASDDTQDYGCDDVLARKAVLFGNDPITFPPAGC